MTRLSAWAVASVLLIFAAGCHNGSPASPSPAGRAPGEPFEVTGVVADERGTPMAGATVTMGYWLGGFVQRPSVPTDATGSYRIGFTANPLGSGFVARAEVVAEGYEVYWRSLRRTGATAFTENFRLDRIVRITAGDSIVLRVPTDVGACVGWVAEVCPVVRVTVPSQGLLTIAVEPIGESAERPPVEVCCIGGDERGGNPITVPVSPDDLTVDELYVKVGLRRGFATPPSFLVKTSYSP